MTAEVANGFVDAISATLSGLKSHNSSVASKKSREIERRRRRRKQKKNKQNVADGDDSDTATEISNGFSDKDSKQKSTDVHAPEPVKIEYVPEKAELDGILDDDFRKIFERFSFRVGSVVEEHDKKDEKAADAALKKKQILIPKKRKMMPSKRKRGEYQTKRRSFNVE